METITFIAELTVVKCWCGIRHAVPAELADFQLRQHRDGETQTGIYCPLGHVHIKAGRGEAAKLREELEAETTRRIREQQTHDQTKAKLRETEKSRAAEKSAKTRLRNRAAAAVCPCCNRTFKQLAAHLKAKHPNFTVAN